MKALSIHADFAFAIASGWKKSEYRSWQTNYRGDLLICTGQKFCGKGLLHGHAICVANLHRIRRLRERSFAWRLNHIRLIEPFPVKGKLSLFEVPTDDLEYMDFSDVPEATDWERFCIWNEVLKAEGTIDCLSELFFCLSSEDEG